MRSILLIAWLSTASSQNTVTLTNKQMMIFEEKLDKISEDNLKLDAKLSSLLDYEQRINTKLDMLNVIEVSLNNINRTTEETVKALDGPLLSTIKQVNEYLGAINNVVSDISAIINTIQTLLQSQEITTLTNIENAILASNNILNEIAAEITNLGPKILTIISEAEFSIAAPEFTLGALELDVCEYDPLGIGPITCELAEAVGFAVETAKLVAE